MPNQEPLIITLDGPAGVGKSTLAKRIADSCNLPYMDTGAMFRAVAVHLGEGAWTWPEQTVHTTLQSLHFELAGQGSAAQVLVNGRPLGTALRDEAVGLWASHLAQLQTVRSYLKRVQQDMGATTSLVAEGRDMGSVVFPLAQCKVFLDASAEERARRRCEQLRAKGQTCDLDTLTRDLRQRDEQDRNRAIAPLKPAADAHIVDTTHLDLDQVTHKLLRLVASYYPSLSRA